MMEWVTETQQQFSISLLSSWTQLGIFQIFVHNYLKKVKQALFFTENDLFKKVRIQTEMGSQVFKRKLLFEAKIYIFHTFWFLLVLESFKSTYAH